MSSNFQFFQGKHNDFYDKVLHELKQLNGRKIPIYHFGSK